MRFHRRKKQRPSKQKPLGEISALISENTVIPPTGFVIVVIKGKQHKIPFYAGYTPTEAMLKEFARINGIKTYEKISFLSNGNQTPHE